MIAGFFRAGFTGKYPERLSPGGMSGVIQQYGQFPRVWIMFGHEKPDWQGSDPVWNLSAGSLCGQVRIVVMKPVPC